MAQLNIDVVARFAQALDGLDQISRKAGAMEKTFGKLQGGLRALGVGLSVGVFAHFIKSSIDAADRLNDLSIRTGLTGQQLLVMEGAAVRSGVGIETVGEVASKLSKRLNDASKGTGDAAEAFAAMGIKVKDAGGSIKNLDVILGEIGAKFETYEDSAQKGILATAALGKGGDRLIPFLEALEETRKRFERLGITIDKGVLKAADEFNDKLEDLKAVTTSAGRGIATALLPHLINVTEALLTFQKNAGLVQAAIDAAVIPIKVFATGFITLAGAVASASRMLLTQVAVLDKLRQLDFAGAWDEFKIGLEESLDLLKATSSVVGELWKKHEAGAEKASKRRGDAPGVPDLAKLKAANDALAKLLEAQTKISLDADKDITDKRIQLLDKQHAAGEVSERSYWVRLLAIQREGLTNQLSTLDEQIAKQTAARDKQTVGTKERHDAQRELEESLAKRATLERAAGHAAQIASYDASAGLERYQDSVENLNIQILELKGNTAEALRLQQGIGNRDLRRKFMAEGDTGALALLNQTEGLQRAQARFNDLRTEQGTIVDQLQLKEERIQNTLRTGAIGELDALMQTGDARKAYADQLEVVVRNMEAIAAASTNPQLTLWAEQARVSLEKLRAESDLLAQKFNTVLSDSFADAFGDFITGTKKASEAFKSFANAVVNEMARMYAKQLATGLMGGASGGGGVGGLLADLFRKIFSGGSSNPSSAGLQFDYNQGFAMGTDYVPRTGLYKLHQGEAVIPAGENMGGGVTYAPTFNVESGTDRAAILALMRREDQRTVATIADMTRRGGGYSKAVRG